MLGDDCWIRDTGPRMDTRMAWSALDDGLGAENVRRIRGGVGFGGGMMQDCSGRVAAATDKA